MANTQFTQKFPSYVCAGDKITAEIDGFTITARIEWDDSGEKPEDRDEGFWPSKKRDNPGYVEPENYEAALQKAQRIHAAWCKWFFGGVVLSVTKDVIIPMRGVATVVIASDAASLWGIEINYPGSDNYILTDAANELIDDALEYAKLAVKQLVEGVKL